LPAGGLKPAPQHDAFLQRSAGILPAGGLKPAPQHDAFLQRSAGILPAGGLKARVPYRADPHSKPHRAVNAWSR
jgi:hypothetical protein